MSALSRRGDLLDVEVERAVWTRGGRPIGGTLVRFGFAGVFLALALAISEPVTRIVFIVAGIAAALLLVPVMDRRLEAIGATIARADRAAASRWLTQLGKQRIVALFAPHAWVALQRGRLHLILGNGRAAAKSLADCARITGAPELPALLSGQAHGLSLAGDRKEAKPLLAMLEKNNQLSPRDRLDLGIALLDEPGRSSHARAHLEAAREHLGGHARVLAGLALAHARSDTPGEALPLLEAAQLAEEEDSDEVAAELIKRARKTLRPAIEAAEKRERKAKASAEHAAREAAARELPAETRRREKKERRKNKRDKKREAEDKKREAEAAAAKQREAEAEAKRRADEEAKRRAEVEAAAAKQRAEAEAAAAKQRAEAEAAKRRAEAEAAAAKRRAEEEAAAARRREAAAAPIPTFVAPPPPTVAKPQAVAKPPTVAPPPVVAPPKITPAAPPAIDTAGWDDLFGDAPAPPKENK